MKANDDEKQKVGDTPLCKRFEQFLIATNLNSNRLAVRLKDRNPVKFRRWLSGEATPNANSLKPIADMFGMRVDWLLSGSGEMMESAHTEQMVRPPQGEIDGYWKAMYEDLKEKFDKQAARIEKLETSNQELTKQHVELVRLFEGSPSQITAYPFQAEPASRMEVAGFGREPQGALLGHLFNLVPVGKRFYVAQVKRKK